MDTLNEYPEKNSICTLIDPKNNLQANFYHSKKLCQCIIDQLYQPQLEKHFWFYSYPEKKNNHKLPKYYMTQIID